LRARAEVTQLAMEPTSHSPEAMPIVFIGQLVCCLTTARDVPGSRGES